MTVVVKTHRSSGSKGPSSRLAVEVSGSKSLVDQFQSSKLRFGDGIHPDKTVKTKWSTHEIIDDGDVVDDPYLIERESSSPEPSPSKVDVYGTPDVVPVSTPRTTRNQQAVSVLDDEDESPELQGTGVAPKRQKRVDVRTAKRSLAPTAAGKAIGGDAFALPEGLNPHCGKDHKDLTDAFWEFYPNDEVNDATVTDQLNALKLMCGIDSKFQCFLCPERKAYGKYAVQLRCIGTMEGRNR